MSSESNSNMRPRSTYADTLRFGVRRPPALPPIDWLPVELFLNIISDVLYDRDALYYHRLHSLQLVCRKWRNVLTSNKVFWARIISGADYTLVSPHFTSSLGGLTIQENNLLRTVSAPFPSSKAWVPCRKIALAVDASAASESITR